MLKQNGRWRSWKEKAGARNSESADLDSAKVVDKMHWRQAICHKHTIPEYVQQTVTKPLNRKGRSLKPLLGKVL